MAELNLSKADQAAAEALDAHDTPLHTPGIDWPDDEFKCCGSEAVRAALPHILDALADEAEERCSETCGPADLETPPCDFYPASRWLRAKAEELRHG